MCFEDFGHVRAQKSWAEELEDFLLTLWAPGENLKMGSARAMN